MAAFIGVQLFTHHKWRYTDQFILNPNWENLELILYFEITRLGRKVNTIFFLAKNLNLFLQIISF